MNMNRYSYCLNNPLKYVDPSGDKFLECLDWIRDKDGSIQYDPSITKDSKLKAGQTYLGETYSEKGVNYRKDGSILFSNENAGDGRIWDNSVRNKIEEMGIITNKGVLVLPNYLNTEYHSYFFEYGYDAMNGNVVDPISGNTLTTFGLLHTHPNGSGPTGFNGDGSFMAANFPFKPMYVLMNSNSPSIAFILGSENPFNWQNGFSGYAKYHLDNNLTIDRLKNDYPLKSFTDINKNNFKLLIPNQKKF
jgi:hypothetical protein